MYRNIYHSFHFGFHLTSSWAMSWSLQSLMELTQQSFHRFEPPTREMGRPASSEMSCWIAWICSTISLMSSLTWKKEVYDIWSKCKHSMIPLCLRTTNVFSPGYSCLRLLHCSLAPHCYCSRFLCFRSYQASSSLQAQDYRKPTRLSWSQKKIEVFKFLVDLQLSATLILPSYSQPSHRPTNAAGAFWPIGEFPRFALLDLPRLPRSPALDLPRSSRAGPGRPAGGGWV